MAALIAAIAAFSFMLGFARISGSSMEPTLKNGQLVLCWKLESYYKKGDIVSIRLPDGERVVKRIAAVGGDTVDIKEGVLYVNGIAEEGQAETEPGASLSYPLTIEKGRVFVLGDNRSVSSDSRHYGPILLDQIKGKILINE